MSLSLNSYYKGSRGGCGAGGLYEGVPSAHLDKPPLSRCIKKYINHIFIQLHTVWFGYFLKLHQPIHYVQAEKQR